MHFTTTRVLHGFRYIGVADAARMIRSIPNTCHTRPYIECIVTYNEAVDVCSKFADALRDPRLRDVDTFMAVYEQFDDDVEADADPYTVQWHDEDTE